MTAVRLSTLDERYLRQDGTIFLTGVQAIVRLVLDQGMRADRDAGPADRRIGLGLPGLAARWP